MHMNKNRTCKTMITLAYFSYGEFFRLGGRFAPNVAKSPHARPVPRRFLFHDLC